jgi:hypothetical protein
MKALILFAVSVACYTSLNADIYVPRQDTYNYFYQGEYNYSPYYPYTEYQPYNGPMRGPNSLDAYKYGGRYRYNQYYRP